MSRMTFVTALSIALPAASWADEPSSVLAPPMAGVIAPSEAGTSPPAPAETPCFVAPGLVPNARDGYLSAMPYTWYGYDPSLFDGLFWSGEPAMAPADGAATDSRTMMAPPYGPTMVGSAMMAPMDADTRAGFESMRIIGTFAVSPVSPADLMPIPLDPNDPVMRASTGRSGLGPGYALLNTHTVARFSANVKLDMFYDTGLYTDGPSPSSLALDGSDEAHGRGVFDMAVSDANLKSDVQLPNEYLWAQGFYDIKLDEEGVEFQQLYGRINTVLGGQYWSTFSDQWVLPQTIVADAAPAGAVYRPQQVQLHYSYVTQSGWRIGTAVERPENTDFQIPVGATRLRRYPDFVSRVRYQPGAWQGAQVAAVVRPMGYEDAGGLEEFATGWGVSGSMNVFTWGADNVQLGCTGGEGLGSYLFGFANDQSAAFDNAGQLQPLRNFGCFAGYQHFWSPGLWSNAAYGFCETETIPGVADSAKDSQNAWTNLMYDIVPGKAAVALEYHYAVREVASGVEGDNHRIMLALQVGMGFKQEAPPEGPSASEQSAARSVDKGYFTDDGQPPAPAAPAAGRNFTRL